MGKYLLLWELDRTKIPVDPKERGVEFDMFMKLIKQDIKKGILKDWGLFVGEDHGYSVVQGTEIEVIKTVKQYNTLVYFAAHPVASVNQAGGMIKALSK
jgi:hypothetical protein